jgi:hypothetical protein
MNLERLWSRSAIALLGGFVLILLPILADSELHKAEDGRMLPRGRGFSAQKQVELIVSRLEQRICAGKLGEVRALLEIDQRRQCGPVWDDILSGEPRGSGRPYMNKYVDLSPKSINLSGNKATVVYRLKICLRDDSNRFVEIVNDIGTLRLLKSARGWRLTECNQLLVSLSSAVTHCELGPED